VEFLEARLPPGDAFLGTLLGSWLIAPRLLADSSLLDNTADRLHENGPIAPFFAESESENLAVVHFSFPDNPLESARSDVTLTEANRDTATEAAGLAPADWAEMTPLTCSSARFTPPSLPANGTSHPGQEAGFFEMRASGSGLGPDAALLGDARSSRPREH